MFSLFNYAAGLWNSGVLTYNSVALAEDSTFTFAGKTWTIDYDATTKGANVAGAQSGSYVNISTAAAADPSGRSPGRASDAYFKRIFQLFLDFGPKMTKLGG